MASRKPLNPYVFVFCFVVGFAAFWASARQMPDVTILDLGSLLAATPRLAAVWNIYSFWGTFAAIGLAAFLYRRMAGQDLQAWYEQRRRGVWGVLAALVFAMSLCLRLAVLDRAYMTDDESAYLFTAKTLLSGHLQLASPYLSEFYDRVFLINDGHFYSQYFLGWPALLAIAVWSHALDLLNPLLCALTVIPLALVLERYCRGPAVLGGLLIYSGSLLSLVSGATLLSYTAALFFLVCFAHFSLRTAEDAEAPPGSAVLAALCGSAAFFIRPSAAILVAGPLALYLIWMLVRRKERSSLIRLMLFLSVGAVCAAAFLFSNYVTFGGPFTTGYALHRQFEIARGYRLISVFLYDVDLKTLLDPAHFVGALLPTLDRVATDMLGMPMLALLIAILCFAPKRTWPHAAAVIAAISLYVSIWDLGTDTFGPAHLLEVGGALIVLVAAGSERLAERLHALMPALDPHRAVVAALAAVTLCAWVTYYPLRIVNVAIAAANINKPFKAAASLPGPALVFCQRPFIDQRAITPLRHFVYFIPANTPDFGDKVLWVNDLGDEKNRALIEQFPGRTPYRLAWTQNGAAVLIPIDRVNPG